ncbi:TIGR03790 family protein [Limnoglobus roseus]|uniref:TIGR03790 family protein n=1 Tax=Limnoglobus roseus TaxID=2598579 RepID=A0A5C1AGV4_9BACT|nr:TIGR03790 family protein [Limnoglobus roseus]QEL18050.1 TIGR03790 family protein [Limnoglobus roseus]
MTRPLLALFATVLFLATTRALEPAEIVVLVNRKVAASREVADHYVAKRGVPKENVVELNLPTGEDISRAEYDRLVLPVLREALGERKDKVKCLLATYGIPLRVGGQEPTRDEKQELETLKPKLQQAKDDLAALEKAEKKDAVELTAARANLKRLEEKQAALSHKQSEAAFDSELMLLWQKEYRLVRWQPNPLHWQFPVDQKAKLPPVLMTCRLDGPTPEIAKRLIDDAVEVEAVGLTGKVYVDARGIGFDPKKPGDSLGYGGYDESFREMAALFQSAKFDVTLDNKNETFAADSCPDAALYAGWYAHGNYQPCCRFVKGAIAWHLASSEAVTLRKPDSKVWCPNLLKAGVAATLGPVAEPYTIGFPKPAEFFGFLATGKYTLVEAYARTVYFTSWMTVLVGDPLYNPYKKTPKLDETQVVPSPKGGAAMFK